MHRPEQPSDRAPGEPPRFPGDQTSMHVRRARDGDDASLAWVVARMTPLLLAQARFRLGRALASHYEPEDLVQDVWLRAIPKLPDLRAREDRLTPVLVRFLSSTLLNRYRNLLDKHLGSKPLREVGAEDALPAAQGEVLQQVIRSELEGAVFACIETLDESDRQVLVLRMIEQAPLAEVAAILGISENHVSVRCHRALKRLRKRLPESVFDELDDSA